MPINKLRVLLVEDDMPASIESSLNSVMSRQETFLLDVATTKEEASICLTSNTAYDLVLLDIRLGDDKWAGSNLFFAHNKALNDLRTPVVLYSAKPDARDALKGLSFDDGLFLFLDKGAEHFDDLLKEAIAKLLRRRVIQLCQCADLTSVQQMLKSREAKICTVSWSIDSLCAPFLHQLPDEHMSLNLDDVLNILFPTDNFIRIFTYWFKAQQNEVWKWPGTKMYGLTELRDYHMGTNTGPMDALMHDSTPNLPCYHEAGAAAINDLKVISLVCSEPVISYFRNYIEQASKWKKIHNRSEVDERDNFKQSVMFKFGSDVVDVIAQSLGLTRDDVLIHNVDESIFYHELYCAPDVAYKTIRPVICNAILKIAQSLLTYAKGEKKMYVSGSSVSYTDNNKQLPYINLAILHQGEVGEKIDGWFGANHDLGKAARLLKGYATWTVLSKSDSTTRSYDAVLRQKVSDEAAINLWNQFINEGSANVIHVLRFGIPLVFSE